MWGRGLYTPCSCSAKYDHPAAEQYEPVEHEVDHLSNTHMFTFIQPLYTRAVAQPNIAVLQLSDMNRLSINWTCSDAQAPSGKCQTVRIGHVGPPPPRNYYASAPLMAEFPVTAPNGTSQTVSAALLLIYGGFSISGGKAPGRPSSAGNPMTFHTIPYHSTPQATPRRTAASMPCSRRETPPAPSPPFHTLSYHTLCRWLLVRRRPQHCAQDVRHLQRPLFGVVHLPRDALHLRMDRTEQDLIAIDKRGRI